jgi:hypothetical protein
MLNFRRLGLLMLGLLVLVTPTLAATAAVPAAPQPETARVWFLRPASPVSRVFGAAPMIYANGAPVGTIPPNSDFDRNFAPGTYSFTVQPYGMATGETDTLRLLPGSRTYLEVLSAPVWELGYTGASRGWNSHSFFVLNLSPQLARAYLSGLTYLGSD